MCRMSYVKRLVLLSISLFVLASCAPTTKGGGGANLAVDRPTKTRGLLSIFLTLKDPTAYDIGLVCDGIDALSGEQWYPVSGAITIEAGKIGTGQVLLARSLVPVGSYSAIRLRINKAFLKKGDGESLYLSLTGDQVTLRLAEPLHIKSWGSASLFLKWNLGASLKNRIYLSPAISIAPKLKHLVADLAYVACPDIDTVYIVRTDKNWVYDSFGVRSRPIYIRKHPRLQDQILYILTRGDSGIKIFSPASNHVIQSLTIPMTTDPVFFVVGPKGRWAYVLDRQGDYLVKMDLTTGGLGARVRLGYSPNYLLYLEDRDLLAVSQGQSQSVLLLDPDDLRQVGRISTNSGPDGLAYGKGMLYVAEKGSNSIMVYDLEQNRQVRRVNVGFGPRRLLYGKGYLFVANTMGGYLSVIMPRQLGVARNIRLAKGIFELALNSSNRWLYVGNMREGVIHVVDPTALSHATDIELKTRLMGLSIVR